ncbi:MAG: PorP/SprF family type IX secretion system membrane protein [Paludibacteraceae bacterium]|nr:PorP/SprF family type IX secretion system membrane protein [Paludibacteraceae bacterium]
MNINELVKRYIVLLVLAVVSAEMVDAQFDPQIGQYMYLPTAYNPAAAGEGDLMKVAGLHRMQYVDIANAPMSTYFSFTSPFVIGKTKHGAGVRFLNDKYGLFTNQTLHVQYAYRQRLGKGYLSAGVDLGFVNVGFKGDSVNLDEFEGTGYHTSSDEVIPKGSKSGMGFDMGVGLYYSTNKWWVGASYSHAVSTKIVWDEYTELKGLRGTMYVAGGYHYRFKHHKEWQLQPSAMVMTDFRSWDANLTLMCDYKDRYRWGVGYRIAGSVNLLVNVDIISGLSLGYSCELPTNKLLLESYGTHEIYLAYGFDILKPKRTNKYKSVRYL